jgi:hypothetical protein
MKTVTKVIIWSLIGILAVGFAYLFHKEMKRVKAVKAAQSAAEAATELVTNIVEG